MASTRVKRGVEYATTRAALAELDQWDQWRPVARAPVPTPPLGRNWRLADSVVYANTVYWFWERPCE